MSTQPPEDILDQLALNPPEGDEAQGSERESLPDKAWLLVRVVGEGGKVEPEVRSFEFPAKDDAGQVIRERGQVVKKTVQKWHVALEALGGDPLTDPAKHRRAYVFHDFWVEGKDGTINLMFMGFLNALFARGIGLDDTDKDKRKAIRWNHTMHALKAARDNSVGIPGPEAYSSMNEYLAVLASEAIKNGGEYCVLIKTKHRTYTTRQGAKGLSVEIGAFEDAVRENLDNRGISGPFPGVALATDFDEMTI